MTSTQHEHQLTKLTADERIDHAAVWRSTCACGNHRGLYNGRLDAALDYADHVRTGSAR